MTEHQVQMKATRKNMIEMLVHTKKYLKTLSDEELFEMGVKLGYWSESND